MDYGRTLPMIRYAARAGFRGGATPRLRLRPAPLRAQASVLRVRPAPFCGGAVAVLRCASAGFLRRRRRFFGAACWPSRSAPRSRRPASSRRRRASVPALLLAAAAAARARRAGLRLRQALGDPAGDLLDRPEPLARRLEQLRRARRVALGGGEQRRADLACGISSAALTSFAAFSSCRCPREFASAPSSRFASGYSCDALRSSCLRTARESRHVQRARI